jgi:hypothetical protein
MLSDALIMNSPVQVTRGNMDSIQIRIQTYVDKHHVLPKDLSDLPQRPDHADSIVDGWGRPLAFAPQPDGSVVITSLGKDGAHNSRSIRFTILDPGDETNSGKEYMTFGNMEYVENIIKQYAKANHLLPSDLSACPELKSFETVDGWDVPFLYIRSANNCVLTSHGQPGSTQIFSLQFEVPNVKSGGG